MIASDEQCYFNGVGLLCQILFREGKGFDFAKHGTHRRDTQNYQGDCHLGKDVNGTLLNAARLGLVFNNDYSSSVILRLSDSQNAPSQQVFNTVVGGVTLGYGQVLSWNKSGVQAVADPSVLVTDYTVSFGASDMSVPQKPLCVMNLNQIYTVDVYFYLEGCDPDCSESITHNEADLYLAVYGISGRKGDR